MFFFTCSPYFSKDGVLPKFYCDYSVKFVFLYLLSSVSRKGIILKYTQSTSLSGPLLLPPSQPPDHLVHGVSRSLTVVEFFPHHQISTQPLLHLSYFSLERRIPFMLSLFFMGTGQNLNLAWYTKPRSMTITLSLILSRELQGSSRFQDTVSISFPFLLLLIQVSSSSITFLPLYLNPSWIHDDLLITKVLGPWTDIT